MTKPAVRCTRTPPGQAPARHRETVPPAWLSAGCFPHKPTHTHMQHTHGTHRPLCTAHPDGLLQRWPSAHGRRWLTEQDTALSAHPGHTGRQQKRPDPPSPASKATPPPQPGTPAKTNIQQTQAAAAGVGAPRGPTTEAACPVSTAGPRHAHGLRAHVPAFALPLRLLSPPPLVRGARRHKGLTQAACHNMT